MDPIKRLPAQVYIFKNPWVRRSGPWPNLSLTVRKVCNYDALGLFNAII